MALDIQFAFIWPLGSPALICGQLTGLTSDRALRIDYLIKQSPSVCQPMQRECSRDLLTKPNSIVMALRNYLIQVDGIR